MNQEVIKKVEFSGAFGDELKKVDISHYYGNFYTIRIANFYQGTIEKRHGRWIGHLHENYEVTGADIDILGDIVDEGLGQNAFD